MQPITPCQAANEPTSQEGCALSHWPVQIRLIPTIAPFLENCDLLIAVDCTVVSYVSLQQDFIAGRP